MKAFGSPAVASVFRQYPRAVRRRLMFLRQLIFTVAAATDGVGEIEETLKWGEPAYVTAKSKSGSTIRIDRSRSSERQYAMYFLCQTTLVATFRTLFPTEFRYEGNRSIVFDDCDPVPVEELSYCIAMALTYNRDKARKNRPPAASRPRRGAAIMK